MTEIVVESPARPRARGGSELARIRVAEAMNQKVIACGPETPLREVAYTMATSRIHCVIVVRLDSRGATGWSVVSDLDVVEAADQAGWTTAGQAAATELVAVAAGETLERAAQIMAEHEIAHVVVVDDRCGQPVGVLSTLDVARVIACGAAASRPAGAAAA